MIKRVLTAAILIPIVIFAIFYLSPVDFACAVGLVLSLAMWEWSAIIGIKNGWYKFLYIVGLWALFAGMQYFPILVVLTVGFIAWIIAAALVFCYEKEKFLISNELTKKAFGFYLIFGWIIFAICWFSLSGLHTLNPKLVLLILLIIWAADTGAYCFGIPFGRHKLVPRVSPKKSIEGLIGGIIVGMIVTPVFVYSAGILLYPLWLLLIISFITILFSVVGDLFESVVKRQAKIKDSGSLLPGHGGILDRIDSMLAATPIFIFFLLLFGFY